MVWNRMQKSLINPNQCWLYGMPICYNPTDPDRKLGFQVENLHIPLEMRGTTALFTSQTPPRKEMDTYEKFIM